MRVFKKEGKEQYIIIAGCGRLGAGLASSLSLKKHNVVIIDREERAFRKLSPSYGGLTMCADAENRNSLEDAGIRKADVFIEVTDRDNVNIMTVEMAQQMYGVEHVLTRIYDEDKLSLLEGSGVATFCPTQLSEKEIDRFMEWGI